MSNHTIDEKAFQVAFKVFNSEESHHIRDDILRKGAGTRSERCDEADKTICRLFLTAYLELTKG